MKCYSCGEEASVAVREQAMFVTMETTKFFCRDCYDKGRRSPSPEGAVDVIVLCPKCGTKNLRTDNQCRKCDTDLSEAKKRLVEDKLRH
jgi:Zn finger protein HypA/HybF involved in hydrogenase expression